MRQHFRPAALVALGTLALAVLAGCSGSPGPGPDGSTKGDAPPAVAKAAVPAVRHTAEVKPPPRSANPHEIAIDNFVFNPRELTVPVGTKVTWVNHDDVPHTATSTARPRAFDSRTLDTDGSFEHVFTTPGTYEYFCAVHPHMTGKIIVK